MQKLCLIEGLLNNRVKIECFVDNRIVNPDSDYPEEAN